MPDNYASYQPGMEAPFSSTEEASYGAADHEFVDLPRAAIVIVTASAGGTLTMRLAKDSADIALPFAAGVHLFRGRISHVRNSGTTNIARVIGVGGKG